FMQRFKRLLATACSIIAISPALADGLPGEKVPAPEMDGTFETDAPTIMDTPLEMRRKPPVTETPEISLKAIKQPILVTLRDAQGELGRSFVTCTSDQAPVYISTYISTDYRIANTGITSLGEEGFNDIVAKIAFNQRAAISEVIASMSAEDLGLARYGNLRTAFRENIRSVRSYFAEQENLADANELFAHAFIIRNSSSQANMRACRTV
ncbi:MAG: hypothetical protein AAF988_00895, partial [Pseudomonadota bacterium]